MGKIHLKSAATDRLALCKIWPDTNWVLWEVAEQQATGSVCKICSVVAGKLNFERGCEKSISGGGVHAALLKALTEATLRKDSAFMEFTAATSKIPSSLPHPDGLQHINNASAKLTAARHEVSEAHARLNDYVERGIVPEDLKRSG